MSPQYQCLLVPSPNVRQTNWLLKQRVSLHSMSGYQLAYVASTESRDAGALRDTSWCDPVRRPIASSIPKRAGLVPVKLSGSDALETTWKRCRKYINF